MAGTQLELRFYDEAETEMYGFGPRRPSICLTCDATLSKGTDDGD